MKKPSDLPSHTKQLVRIGAIYKLEEALKGLTAEERLKERSPHNQAIG